MAIESVWVVADVADGRPAGVALELLTAARSLGAAVSALVFSPHADAVVATLGEYGAETVYSAADPALGDVLAGGPAADALARLARTHRPDLILLGSTYDGRDIAGRLAARLDVPVIANGLDLSAADTASVHTAIFGGADLVTTAFAGRRPQIALIRPRSFVATAGGCVAPRVVPVAVDLAGQHGRARVMERVAEAGSGPKLEDASVVVSGGRGLGGPEGFQVLGEFARMVHGAVGASRAVVDAGWVPYAMQIGQTGKTVKPTVYIACGISGAMQHTVGMKGAQHIVAINKDEHAPIFKLADLGVVGDVVKILPQVIEELRSRQ
jgi:electron transfer flavoprotein alpha subunit